MVTAVASSAEKLDVAAGYGAKHLVNHRDGGLRDALRGALPDGADAVIDPVGGELSEPALRALRRGGRFVTVGYASGVIPRIPLNLVLVKGVRILVSASRCAGGRVRAQRARTAELFTSRRVLPHIGAVYPLSETACALSQVADGKAIGKVLIDIGRASPPATRSAATGGLDIAPVEEVLDKARGCCRNGRRRQRPAP